ncbi:hypothetical protein CC86DRAFT_314581 [Ophiobolus disseminans]|uniref:Uncharacterized protein n=1 Tax=Ophiobolus disseminans TaxID=1469910 RepID=A0A6A7AF20_9PLEO|nr:hypothetical protein CC86DRAFT_314581 [Ophiobolus disseminans]
MQQHGPIQSTNGSGNIANSPSIKFYLGDQKPAHTQTFSIAAPKRRGTSLVGVASNVPFLKPLIRLWKRGWTAEVLSCVFALLSLIGLVATLIAHQGKPLPQWPKLISLNSIISLFSLLIRTGVCVVLAEGISQSKWMWYRKARKLDDMERFDSASRGAFGAFLLLINLGPRRPHWIAAFGALLTIMTAFTGFASQQLLQFNECLQEDTAAQVGIARANSFYLQGPRLGARVAMTAEPLQEAIEVGIIQPGQDLTAILSSGCITGNCTFPTTDGASFSSFGFGHSCVDETANVIKILTNQTFSLQRGDNSTAVAYWANLTSPGPSQFIGDRTGLLIGANPYTIATGAYDGSNSGVLSIIQMVFRRKMSDLNNTAAYSCSIFPTINTYKVSINNTVLREDLVESLPIGLNMMRAVTQNSNMDDRNTLFKRASTSVLRNGIREMCLRQDTPRDGFVMVAEANIDAAPRNITTYPLGVAKRVWYYPEECVWRLGLGTATGIHKHLVTVFKDQRVLYQEDVAIEGSLHLLKLFRQGNMSLDTVDGYMGNLTTSLTTVARTMGINNAPATGTMWYTTTCLGINWPWLSFDAAMIVLSAIFLLLVSIESRDVESERLWKSSILATLFCEIDDPVTRALQPAKKEDMETIASSTSVSLDPNSRKLKLIAR